MADVELLTAPVERYTSLNQAYNFLFSENGPGTHKNYSSSTQTEALTAEQLAQHNIYVFLPSPSGEPTNEYGQVLCHVFHEPDGSVSVDVIGSTRPKHFQGSDEAQRLLIARENIQPWKMVDVPRDDYIPPQAIGELTVGMENEIGVGPGGVEFSEELKDKISLLQTNRRAGGKITGEVVAEEIELNTAPVNATIAAIRKSFTGIFSAVIASTVPEGEEDSRVFVSSLNPHPEMGSFPNDDYVRKFMGPFIANEMLHLNPEVVAYINTYGHECFLDEYNREHGRALGTHITIDELLDKSNGSTQKLRQKIVEWFSAMAIHTHVSMPTQNKNAEQIEIKDDNSSTFILNAMTFGPSQVRNALSLSSFALNGYLLTNSDQGRLHDGKRRHRHIFKTARYQTPVRTIKKAISHVVESISSHSPSITRALTGNSIDAESWHGVQRKRGELGTIEILAHDSTTSVELSSALSMADALDSFLLSHLYKEGSLEKYGVSMEEVRKYYCLPEGWDPSSGSYEVDFADHELDRLKERYEQNRLALQEHGVDAEYIAPDGTTTTYGDHLIGHRKLVRNFFSSYEETTGTKAVELSELIQVDKWLIRASEVPSVASIESYHDPRSEDYMRGNMGYHLWHECKRLIDEVMQYGECLYQFKNGILIQFKPEDMESFKEKAQRNYYPELISWYMDNIVGPVQRNYIRNMATKMYLSEE